MKSLKLIAALLGYPTAELIAALPEIERRLFGEWALGASTRDALSRLIQGLSREDLMDAQERYVAQFDVGRGTSLHLFEHVHGDSRDRGQAMVDLKARYSRAGLDLDGKELPDFLPAVLEYLSTQPAEEAHEILADCAHIVRTLGERLLGAACPYAAVFSALLELQGEPPVAAKAGVCDRRNSIDDDWEEEPVEFGPPSGLNALVPRGTRPRFIRFVPRHAHHG